MADSLFGASSLQPFMPHGMCLLWREDLLLLHVLSDTFIALSYYSIPLALSYFVAKREDLQFRGIFFLFSAFILACGSTHVLQIWTIWQPDYLVEGFVKLFTAVVSAATAIYLWPLIPHLLRIPSPSSLEQANLRLQEEIELREQHENRVTELNNDLEKMVQARTQQLTQANIRLEQEARERKVVEAALMDRDRRKDEFLAMLAHELRNPLAPISNAATILGMLQLDHPQIPWVREMIERQVQHLTRMVDDLLDVSRLVRGKITLNKARLNLAELIDRVSDTMRPHLAANRHSIELRLPDQPIWLEGDPVRLSQVLINLLDNAINYSPEDAPIEISAGMAGEDVEIRVRDYGSGVPPELRLKMFDLFEQGERTLDRPQGGLGIGLTIVRRLVEMHGGRVTVGSPDTGPGSVFSVRLPALDPAAVRIEPETRSPPAPSDGLRVVVVDDEPDVRESTALVLTMKGYDVRVADSGASALPLIEVFHPQLVLLDIGLPGEDGYQVARRIRGLPGGRELLLVALSGYGRAEDSERSREAGFDHHLLKPLQLGELHALLAERGEGPG